MVNPVDANRASLDAAEAVGTGAADSVAVTCDLIRIGVFFDGTGNSRAHASRGDVSWHTNVDLLEHLYETTIGPEERQVGGQTREVNYASIYARGIGVEAEGGTTSAGMGLGTGDEGVRNRVEQTIQTLRTRVRLMARGMEVCDLWFDAFGFSRGAAAARHFANRVNRGAIPLPGAEADVKFLGLFDTVVMIGFGVTTEGSSDNVNVRTRSVADRIVHITADDEIRENFPLTLAFGETRIRMVGVHSDIGGGYSPTARADQGDSFEFEHEDYPGLPDYLRLNWGLTSSHGGPDDPASPDTLRTRLQSRWQPHDAGEPISTFTWRAVHGLQFVSLRLMHDHAIAAGVPFDPLPGSIAGTSIAIPPMLRDYYDALKTRSVTAAQEREVRLRHSHVSFNDNTSAAGLISPHLPRPDARRQVDRH